jgi:hypothetical protein
VHIFRFLEEEPSVATREKRVTIPALLVVLLRKGGAADLLNAAPPHCVIVL